MDLKRENEPREYVPSGEEDISAAMDFVRHGIENVKLPEHKAKLSEIYNLLGTAKHDLSVFIDARMLEAAAAAPESPEAMGRRHAQEEEAANGQAQPAEENPPGLLTEGQGSLDLEGKNGAAPEADPKGDLFP